MFVPQYLTDEILAVLRIELSYWIRDGIYRTHAEFVNNLIQFANICLQDTHPTSHIGQMVEDPEMENYLSELKEFVNRGGFRGELRNLFYLKTTLIRLF